MTYLRQAITDPGAAQLLSTTIITPEQHDGLISDLRKKYDKKRVIHQHHVMSLVNCPPVRQGSYKELSSWVETYRLNMTSLKNTKRYDLGSFLTSLATTQLPKNLTELWKFHSKENPGVPDIDELLDFMSDYADATEGSILISTNSEPREPIKKPKAAVYKVQSSQPRERTDSCTACHHSSVLRVVAKINFWCPRKTVFFVIYS